MKGTYSGPSCPYCAAPLDPAALSSGEQSCPVCASPFIAKPFAPPSPLRPEVSALGAAGPGGAVPCGRHAGNAATATCSRCGVFMCTLCRVDIDGQELCPECFDRLSAEGALPSARSTLRNYRGIALGLGIGGCLVYCVGLVTGPLAFYFGARALRQRRELGEREGLPAIVIAMVLAGVQIVVNLTAVGALLYTSLESHKLLGAVVGGPK